MVLIYIVCRSGGKILGPIVPIRISDGLPVLEYSGLGMLSQAGVAMGLSALALSELSAVEGGTTLAHHVFTIVLVSNVIFEIIGPIGTKTALDKAGELEEK